MKAALGFLTTLSLLGGAFIWVGNLGGKMTRSVPASTTEQQVIRAHGLFPLSFETNQGQTDSQVKFLARGRGYTVFLTATEAVLSLHNPTSPRKQRKTETTPEAATTEHSEPDARATLRIQLIGANPSPHVVGVGELPGKSNYFIGSDPKKWHRNVSHYARVHYRNVYPGVDLFYYGTNQRQLEYDFVVAPGADPNAITLAFEGANDLKVDDEGNLILRLESGEVIQHAPVVYQENDGVRHTVDGSYLLRANNQVGFHLATYDATRPLRFFLAERFPPRILTINTQTGAATASPILSRDINWLGFHTGTSKLKGVTACCPNQFVSIDVTTGALTVLGNVGDSTDRFAAGAAAIDSVSNLFFLVKKSSPGLLIIHTETGAVTEKALSQEIIFLGLE